MNKQTHVCSSEGNGKLIPPALAGQVKRAVTQAGQRVCGGPPCYGFVGVLFCGPVGL
jgi:hypothetical protein